MGAFFVGATGPPATLHAACVMAGQSRSAPDARHHRHAVGRGRACPVARRHPGRPHDPRDAGAGGVASAECRAGRGTGRDAPREQDAAGQRGGTAGAAEREVAVEGARGRGAPDRGRGDEGCRNPQRAARWQLDIRLRVRPRLLHRHPGRQLPPEPERTAADPLCGKLLQQPRRHVDQREHRRRRESWHRYRAATRFLPEERERLRDPAHEAGLLRPHDRSVVAVPRDADLQPEPERAADARWQQRGGRGRQQQHGHGRGHGDQGSGRGLEDQRWPVQEPVPAGRDREQPPSVGRGTLAGGPDVQHQVHAGRDADLAERAADRRGDVQRWWQQRQHRRIGRVQQRAFHRRHHDPEQRCRIRRVGRDRPSGVGGVR